MELLNEADFSFAFGIRSGRLGVHYLRIEEGNGKKEKLVGSNINKNESSGLEEMLLDLTHSVEGKGKREG